MARTRFDASRVELRRSESYKQVFVDHVFAAEEKGYLRLVVGTDTLVGTHAKPETAVSIETELILLPSAVRSLQAHIKHWAKKRGAKTTELEK